MFLNGIAKRETEKFKVGEARDETKNKEFY
jgi:hypothetical protein